MREIKFRAWDMVNKVMSLPFNVFDIEKSVDKDCLNYMILKTGNTNLKYKDFYYGCIELMQYTGLKDNENKEIYEEDIIINISTGSKAIVKFYEGKFILLWLNGTFETSDCISFYNIKYFSIIGNIFENPELLTEGKK